MHEKTRHEDDGASGRSGGAVPLPQRDRGAGPSVHLADSARNDGDRDGGDVGVYADVRMPEDAPVQQMVCYRLRRIIYHK